MIQVEQLLSLSIPDRGYQDPDYSPNLRLSSEYIDFLTHPATRFNEEYCSQVYIAAQRMVALMHAWPVQEQTGWGKRWAMNTQTLLLSEKDYFKLKAHPAALTQYFKTDIVKATPLSIDESAVRAPILTEEQAKWLIRSFTQEQLSGILTVMWLHKKHSEYKASITVPCNVNPLDLIHLLLKIPSYPCRPISFTTSRTAPTLPNNEEYGLWVYRDQYLTVDIQNCPTGRLHDVISDSLKNLANMGKVQDVFDATYEELAKKLDSDLAYNYALAEYGASGKELQIWLAQQYVTLGLYSRASRILGGLKE